MRYRRLGRTGLRVSELCLGTMTFGEAWGWGASEEECRRIFERFVEAGGNFIDTANSYTEGESERIVGGLIAGERDRFVIGTKYTQVRRWQDPNGAGNHRKNLIHSLEDSLRRLGTDYVDVLWMHAWDGITPTGEVLRALDDLVRAGKVLYIGASDSPAWVVSQADAIAGLRGWSAFAAIQVEYSLAERTAERELLPMAEALGLGVLAWAPLGAGLLTGKYTAQAGDARTARLRETEFYAGVLNERNLGIAAVVDRVAADVGASASAVALAWLRARRGVIPIVGARSTAQLDQNLSALELTLPPASLATLDAATAIERGFPNAFLESAALRQLVFAGTRDLLDV